MTRNFEEYERAYHEQGLPLIAKQLDAAGLPRIERIALSIMHLIECQRVPRFQHGEPFYTILPKVTTELLAFVGCLRAGSLHGAWQHIRSLHEVHGAVHYLYLAKPGDRAQRVERYLEHGRAFAWLRRQHVRNEHAKQKTGGAKLRVSDAQMKRVEEQCAGPCAWIDDAQVTSWSKLFMVEVVKKPHAVRWHPDKSISEMLLDAGYEASADDDDENDAAWHYQMLCQTTHVSSVGHRLSAGSGPAKLIGWDKDMLANAIATAAGAIYAVARAMDRVHPFGLTSAIQDDVAAFLAGIPDPSSAR